MKYCWDLSDLYSKKEDFYLDMTIVRDKLKELSEYREVKVDGNSLYDLMNKCFSIRKLNYKTLLYASLNYYSDINNEVFIKIKTQAEELDILVLEETGFIDELISIIDLEKINSFYDECFALKEYDHYIKNVKRISEHIVNDSFDKINYWRKEKNDNIREYNNLLNSMEFNKIGDIFLNNSNIGKYLIDSNREIRKIAFSNINNSYFDKKDSFFSIYKRGVECKKEIAKANKYTSVLESELFNENIKDKLIINLINSVNNNIDLMNRYLKFKCDYLKLSDPKLYDINVSVVNIDEKYDLGNAFKILKNAFRIYGKDYIDTMNLLLEKNHLDLECNEKKHSAIVFSWNTYTFMNYRNRYIDLKNLAHEFGHIINSYYSLGNQPFIYSDSTVFIGEIAALVNEILLNEYLYESAFSKEQKIFYLTKNIENFISQVYRQTMYTEFENFVYNSSQISLDLLNDYYFDLVKKYYGKVIAVDDGISCEWMRVGHLFRWNYYVYKYAIGYILAFNVVKRVKEDSSKYVEFLSAGSSLSNEDVLKILDIDLYDDKIIDNGFELLDNYISLLEKIGDGE